MDVCGRIIPINQTWFANIIIIMCHSQAEVVVLSIHVDPTTPRVTLASSSASFKEEISIPRILHSLPFYIDLRIRIWVRLEARRYCTRSVFPVGHASTKKIHHMHINLFTIHHPDQLPGRL